MTLLRLSSIAKTYGQGEIAVSALRGLDLEVHAGEFVALMGASGSGKSTLLNIIGCLDQPTTGEYHLEGKRVQAADHDRLASLRSQTIGFVFQSFNLIPVLSARENVELPMLWHPGSTTRAERKARALALLSTVGMSEQAERRPGALSGGQQQRVAVARALANRPSIVLADEPTANLDTATADQVLDAMTELWKKENVTFVLATHDPRILSRVTRVVYVVDGQVGLGPMHDPETGLFGRTYFDSRLAEELQRAERKKERFSMLAVSADGTTPGSAADALREALRVSDTVARYKTDLYFVLLGGAGSDDAFTVATRVLASQRKVGSNAAVAIVSHDDVSAEELVAASLSAVEKARESGGVYVDEPGADG